MLDVDSRISTSKLKILKNNSLVETEVCNFFRSVTMSYVALKS